MDDRSENRFEKTIHDELARLTEMEAPATLAPRVMAAIRAKALPHWWQRNWFHWPSGLKALSLAVLLAFVFTTLWASAVVLDNAANLISLQPFHHWLDTLADWGGLVETLVLAGSLILNSVGKFWLSLGLAVVLAMYLSCVGMGTICFRLALKKR